MFLPKQRLPIYPVGVGMFSTSSIFEETGFVERRKVSFAQALPDKELFDPTACVKAGKNLDLVNSKVFGISEESFNVYQENNPSTDSKNTDSTSNKDEV